MNDTAGLRVFISYSRKDASAFADNLAAGLEAAGFDARIDRRDIAPSEPWQDRLLSLIHEADTVVFVITPASVESDRCEWEVQRASELSKRILPIVAVDVPESAIPSSLRRLHHVSFSRTSFGVALRELSAALRTNLAWVREHTRLGELAGRWDGRSRPEDLLLRGAELAAARAWLMEWVPGYPDPTAVHRAFVDESAGAQERRQSVERKQLEQLAAAQQQREVALRSLRRRTWLFLLGAGLLLGVTGAWVWRNTEQATRLERTIDDLYRERQFAVQDGWSLEADIERQELESEILSDLQERMGGGQPGAADAGGPPTTRPNARSSWSIDVFWCAGPGEATRRERAKALVHALTGASAASRPFPYERVHARRLSEAINITPQYQIRSNELRAERGETFQGEALGLFAQSLGGPDLTLRPSTLSTPLYLSVFLCADEPSMALALPTPSAGPPVSDLSDGSAKPPAPPSTPPFDRAEWIARVSRELDVEPAALNALLAVECAATSVAERPLIRMEVHHLQKRVPKDRRATLDAHFVALGPRPWEGHVWRADATATTWLRLHRPGAAGQESEWAAFDLARTIDDGAAIEATSVGNCQFLGQYWDELGFSSPQEFLREQYSEEGQLRTALLFFSRVAQIVDALRERDWHAIALRYNGSGQVEWYAARLQEAYGRAKD